MPDSKPAPRWERRKQARPAEIVEAALELFVERGFAATRLDDVAARAGVSKGTLYLYFDSKEALFKEVIRSGIGRAISHGEQVVANFQGSATALLREIVSGWWQLIASTRHSGIPKLMISESRNFPELANFYRAEVIERGSRLFTAALERGIASGEFRAIDVASAARALIAPLILEVIWQHSFACCAREPEVDPRGYFDVILSLAIDGLRPRPDRPAVPRLRTS